MVKRPARPEGRGNALDAREAQRPMSPVFSSTVEYRPSEPAEPRVSNAARRLCVLSMLMLMQVDNPRSKYKSVGLSVRWCYAVGRSKHQAVAAGGGALYPRTRAKMPRIRKFPAGDADSDLAPGVPVDTGACSKPAKNSRKVASYFDQFRGIEIRSRQHVKDSDEIHREKRRRPGPLAVAVYMGFITQCRAGA